MCYNKVLLEYGISKLPSEILYKNKITIRLITINYAFKLKKISHENNRNFTAPFMWGDSRLH